MAASKIQLDQVVTYHAWNKDKSMVAYCANGNDLHISRKGDTKKIHELPGHDQVITGIDWAPNTDRIVTCSQDRNAYVWTRDGNNWKPTLVILRINRAATRVKWSPNENKFAVSSAAKTVSICYFEEENDWWVSKHIKKRLRSTVLCVAWHPGSIFLAAGSADFTCRVFSAQVKGVDKKPQGPTPFDLSSFGECLAEFSANSWVHDVAFSPSGRWLAFCNHDSTLHVVDTEDSNKYTQALQTSDLPFKQVLFLDESRLVGAGFDCNPFLFQADSQGYWNFARKIDAGEKKAGGPTSAVGQARQIFRGQVTRGEQATETTLPTAHQNCITCLQLFDKGSFTSTGVDGHLVTFKG